LTEEYHNETSSTELKALTTKLLELSTNLESTRNVQMHEYSLSREMGNQDESETERKEVAISRLLLARSKGDQLVEYCLMTKEKLEETIASVIKPTTRRQAMESSKAELRRRKK